MNSIEGSRALEIEDDVGIPDQHRLAAQNSMFFAENPTAPKIANHRLNPVIG